MLSSGERKLFIKKQLSFLRLLLCVKYPTRSTNIMTSNYNPMEKISMRKWARRS